MLGAVAVVDVPVDNGNPVNALQCMFRGNCDVVQETEPHGACTLRVVTGRPDKGEGMFTI
jgi:hypothetical protein